MRLWRFAGHDGIYVFPDQINQRDNFGEVRPRTTPMGLLDGGFDDLNGRRAPQGIGNVESTWWIFKEADSSIGPKRDAALAMTGWRKSRLFTRAWDQSQGVRWCWARVNNIRVNESAAQTPHLQQQISANFQVSDPGWNGDQKKMYFNQGHAFNTGLRFGGALYFDDGLTFDSGLRFNPPKLKVQATDGGEYTVTNYGTRAAKAVVKVAALEDEWEFGDGVYLGDGHYFNGGVAPVSSITLTMKTKSQIVNSWFWGDTLEPGEELIINSSKQSVIVDGRGGRRNAYPSFQRIKGNGFFEIPPGSHTITLKAGMGARGARLVVNFWDSYYSS